jgi:PAS domain S-box-containing protein
MEAGTRTIELLERMQENIDMFDMWDTVAARGRWNREARLMRNDGTSFQALIDITALRDAEGCITGYLLGLDDISEGGDAGPGRINFRNVVDQMADAIVITNAEGVIQYVNGSYEDATGWIGADLIGKTPRLLKSGVHDAEFYRSMWERIKTGEVWTGRMSNRRRDGVVIQNDVTISPLRNRSGQVERFIAVMRDVTSVVQMEERVRQAQKLESVGHLAAGIAHEINTPIQFIGDNITFLVDGLSSMSMVIQTLRMAAVAGASDEAIETARKVIESTDLNFLQEEMPKALMQSQEGIARVAEIVRAMKEFSHPGIQVVAPADLNHAIENVLAISRNEWKGHAETEVSLDADLPLVPVHLGEFSQAILNLVINASHAIEDRRASEPDRPIGRIKIESRLVPGMAEITVSDDGCGMSLEVQKRIFDPFFTTKEVGRGTGQGLAMTRTAIVKRLGGHLGFESVPGSGTTFVLHIPLQSTGIGGST